jgi:hypothetical protein
MKSLRAILISSVLPAVAVLSACGEKGGGRDRARTEAPPTTESGDYPKFVREWIGANGLAQSDGADSIANNPKTRQLVEERFRAMEWSNGQAKASFTIELDAERSLEFRSEAGTSKDQQIFSAIWTRPGPAVGGAKSSIVKRSRPIPGAEEALEMLHLFMEKDGDIQSAAEWEG